MSRVSLKQMRYAVAVARHGHFGRAAEACSVSQPALSQQILTLEATCGAPLFDRLKRGVRLTPFGREFVDLAQKAIERADAIDDLIAGRRGVPARPLRFGLIPTIAPYLLPEIFPRLQEALPDIGFAVSESRTDDLVHALGEGTLDLALIASTPSPGGPDLTVEPLFTDPFVLATAPGEAVGGPVPLSEIDTGRILLLDEGHCLRDQTIAACHLEDTDAARTFAATSLSTIVEFVAHGQGVTLLPRLALRKEAASGRIRVHELASPGARRQLALVWRAATPYAAVFRQVAAVIRAAHAGPAPQAEARRRSRTQDSTE